jgi:hypothetical protein
MASLLYPFSQIGGRTVSRRSRGVVSRSGHSKRRRGGGAISEKPKYTYRAFDTKFRPIKISALKAKLRRAGTAPSQLIVHGSSAHQAAKKVVSRLHRAHPTQASRNFLLTQTVVQPATQERATRVYHYGGHFEEFARPVVVARTGGGAASELQGVRFKGRPLVHSLDKRMTIPHTRLEVIKSAYAAQPASKRAGGARTTRRNHTDFYDLEPRY